MGDVLFVHLLIVYIFPYILMLAEAIRMPDLGGYGYMPTLEDLAILEKMSLSMGGHS
tara:strand:+ start:288 stop:458 length:171 start_codon:yes stop_codon:yes gene_type:complete